MKKSNDFLIRDRNKLIEIKASGTGDGKGFNTGLKRDDIVLNPICKNCDYIFKEEMDYCPNCGNKVYMGIVEVNND